MLGKTALANRSYEETVERHEALRTTITPRIENWIAACATKDGRFDGNKLIELATFIGQTCRNEVDAIATDCFSRTLFPEIPAVKLYGCDGFGDLVPDVWLMLWRRGYRRPEATTIHDHGKSRAGIYVVSGVVSEYIYTVDKESWESNKEALSFKRVVRHLRAGETARIEVPHIHRMMVHKTEGYSVHAYGDLPLDAQKSYVSEGSALRPSSTWNETGISECKRLPSPP